LLLHGLHGYMVCLMHADQHGLRSTGALQSMSVPALVPERDAQYLSTSTLT
jgi:hypothetical protein